MSIISRILEARKLHYNCDDSDDDSHLYICDFHEEVILGEEQPGSFKASVEQWTTSRTKRRIDSENK